MVIITFPSGADWHYANWVFRKFAADLVSVASGDNQIVSLIEEAEANHALFLEKLRDDFGLRVMKLMLTVAGQAVRHEVESDYRQAIDELRQTIEKELSGA